MEFPTDLKTVQKSHKELTYAPFELQLGGKTINIVIADNETLYLLYKAQAQVIGSSSVDTSGTLIGETMYHLLELWPTSVLRVDQPQQFEQQALRSFMERVVEFSSLQGEQLQAAAKFLNSLGGVEDSSNDE